MEASFDPEINISREVKDNVIVERELKLPSSDPKDYIRQARLQKLAKEIDPNNNLWEQTVTSYIYAGGESGRVVAARIFDNNDHAFKLVLAEKAADGSEISGVATSKDKMGVFESVVGSVMKKMPDNKRETFVKEAINLIPQAETMTEDQLTTALYARVLDLFPNSKEGVQIINSLPKLPDNPYRQTQPTPEQQSQLLQLIKLASQKMSSDQLREDFFKMLGDLPFEDEAYGKNFQYLLSDVFKWVVEARGEAVPDGTILDKDLETVKFPVQDLIKNPISSADQLADTLKKIEVKPEVDTRGMSAGPLQAEFVPVDKIVGGPGLKNWSVIDSMEGDARNAFTFVKGFTDGSIDLMARDEPIHVYEVGGEYFIGKDGRHRTAALKALGVSFAPMLVTHYS